MRNAYRTVLPAAVMLLLAGCAAPGPPAAVPEPEPIVVEPAPPPPAPPPVEPVVAPRPASTAAPARAEIAVVLDPNTPAHLQVADEIVAALSPRQYRVTRLTTAET